MHLADIRPIEVRRSGLKMWLMSLAGIPLVVLGVDVLRSRRIIGFFQNLIWPNGNPEVLEARDHIWAAALIVVGLIIALYGVIELINPRPAIYADTLGIHVRLGHPLAKASLIPWDELDDIGAEDLDDEGDAVPVLWLSVLEPSRLPAHPWGARWLDTKTIAVLASDWEKAPAPVGMEIAQAALTVAGIKRTDSSVVS